MLPTESSLDFISSRLVDREACGRRSRKLAGAHHRQIRWWSRYIRPAGERVRCRRPDTGFRFSSPSSVTNSDGRCLDLLSVKNAQDEPFKLVEGRTYKVVFKTKEYFERTNRKCFYPWVEVRSMLFPILHPTNLAMTRSPSPSRIRTSTIISHF